MKIFAVWHEAQCPYCKRRQFFEVIDPVTNTVRESFRCLRCQEISGKLLNNPAEGVYLVDSNTIVPPEPEDLQDEELLKMHANRGLQGCCAVIFIPFLVFFVFCLLFMLMATQ